MTPAEALLLLDDHLGEQVEVRVVVDRGDGGFRLVMAKRGVLRHGGGVVADETIYYVGSMGDLLFVPSLAAGAVRWEDVEPEPGVGFQLERGGDVFLVVIWERESGEVEVP